MSFDGSWHGSVMPLSSVCGTSLGFSGAIFQLFANGTKFLWMALATRHSFKIFPTKAIVVWTSGSGDVCVFRLAAGERFP